VLFAVLLAGSGAAQGVVGLVERARPGVAIVVARTGSGLSQESGSCTTLQVLPYYPASRHVAFGRSSPGSPYRCPPDRVRLAV